MLRLNKLHTHLLIFFVAILLNILLQAGALFKLNQLINEGYPLIWAEWWPTVLYVAVAIFLFYGIVLLNLSLNTIFFSSQRLAPLNIPFIFATNILLLVCFSVIFSFLYHTISVTEAPVHSMIFRVMLRFIFPFLAAVLFAYILILIDKVRTAEIDNARLTEEKAKAELASLKEQISPHFLFNTLSSLSAIIRQNDKSSSLKFVDKMSQVYRYILESAEKDVVTVEEELDFLQAFVFLLEKRFGTKFRLNIDIPADWHASKIPPMALQLLVENAIQHNAILQSAPLMVNVSTNDHKIIVQNNIRSDAMNRVSTSEHACSDGFGIGLANLQKRYHLLANQEIIIENKPDVFVVKLPIIK